MDQPFEPNHVEESLKSPSALENALLPLTTEALKRDGASDDASVVSTIALNHDDEHESENISMCEGSSKKRKVRSGDEQSFLIKEREDKTTGQVLLEKRYKASDQDLEITVQEMQRSLQAISDKDLRDENLKVIDIRSVMEMMQSISSKIEDLKESRSADKQEIIRSVRRRLEEDFNSASTFQEKRIEQLESELTKVKKRAGLYENILQYNNNIMFDLTKRLSKVELNNAKKTAIVVGLNITKTKKADLIAEVCDFIGSNMVQNPLIDDVYRLGTDMKNPLVVIFSSIAEKERVFQQKSKLKDTDIGGEVYFNNYLMPEENEKKKRQRSIISENKKKQKPADIEHVKGELKVGSNIYKPKVSAPKPTDLLQYSVEQLDKMLETPTVHGPVIPNKDSTFQAYAVDTDRIQTVRDGYLKVRLLHARARHVVCAFNLPASEGEEHLYSDGCDDDETGASAYVLKRMKESNITNKAFFIVRYCGNEKLNDSRFESYLAAASALLKLKPVNANIKESQVFQEEKPNGRPLRGGRDNKRGGRGRGRGHGNTGKKSYAEAASP